MTEVVDSQQDEKIHAGCELYARAVIATDSQASRWHFVCDNLNIHQSEALVRFVAELSGVEEDLGIKGKLRIP